MTSWLCRNISRWLRPVRYMMASRRVLDGMVPVFRHTPPIMSLRSTIATRRSSLAAAMAAFWPPGPEPITSTSKSYTRSSVTTAGRHLKPSARLSWSGARTGVSRRHQPQVAPGQHGEGRRGVHHLGEAQLYRTLTEATDFNLQVHIAAGREGGRLSTGRQQGSGPWASHQ